MKKIFILLTIFLLFIVNIESKSQTPFAFSAQGGYSWLNGVVGADLQFGKFGISGGWMPTKMPISGTKTSSYGALYSGNYDETTVYGSIGIASQGYRYEYINGAYSGDPLQQR